MRGVSMKVIIDIPDKDYEKLKDGHIPFSILDVMQNGTPIPDNATVCDIEDIKADIEAARYGLINDGLDVALEIIDKHMGRR